MNIRGKFEMNSRERREKLKKLAELKDIHVEVLFYRFLGKPVAEIPEMLGKLHPNREYDTSTVWNRFTTIFKTLGITGDDKQAKLALLIKEYSPIFLEFVKSEEDLERWGFIRAEMLTEANREDSVRTFSVRRPLWSLATLLLIILSVWAISQFNKIPTLATLRSTTSPTVPPTQPTLQPTSIPGPSGNWDVRIGQTDDANILLLNNHIIAATMNTETLDWMSISSMLRPGVPNYLAAINLNGSYSDGTRWGPVIWDFALKHDEVILWRNEGNLDGCLFCYAQTVQISPDNQVEEVDLRQYGKQNLGGTWSAKVIADGVGMIMVNGVPVAGSFWKQDQGWADISGLLYEGQDNLITVAVWNEQGEYYWDVILRQDESIVWESKNSGRGQIGEIFFTTVTIDGTGNIVP